MILLPQTIRSAGCYNSALWQIAAEACRCVAIVDGDELYIWEPLPRPAIGAALLELTGCLDADHTQ